MEKKLKTVVKNQLLKHIERNNLFILEQPGYRENHLCETALNYVIADWKLEINQRNSALRVFKDLKSLKLLIVLYC